MWLFRPRRWRDVIVGLCGLQEPQDHGLFEIVGLMSSCDRRNGRGGGEVSERTLRTRVRVREVMSGREESVSTHIILQEDPENILAKHGARSRLSSPTPIMGSARERRLSPFFGGGVRK